MGRSVVYCVICGGPLENIYNNVDIPDGYDESVLPVNMIEWLSDFRIMGNCDFSGESISKDAQFSISPPASDAEFRCVFIDDSLPPKSSKWNAMGGRKWKVLDQDENGSALYPIHDACLYIMRKVSHRNLHQAKDGAHFTTIHEYYQAMCRLHLRNTTYPYTVSNEATGDWGPNLIEFGAYALEWEHDYYGAGNFANGSGWICENDWEWICADPVEIPDITPWILSSLEQDIRDNDVDWLSVNPIPLPDRAGPHLSTFEKLPSEILSYINMFLQAPSTLRLRRCSKTLASRIVLDQTFWREQLTLGNLIDYLWDLDPVRCRQYDLARSTEKRPFYDWRKLAQRLMTMKVVERTMNLHFFEFPYPALNTLSTSEVDDCLRNAPIGFRNRCRIVKIIRDIERLDKIEAEDPTVVKNGELVSPHKLRLVSM